MRREDDFQKRREHIANLLVAKYLGKTANGIHRGADVVAHILQINLLHCHALLIFVPCFLLLCVEINHHYQEDNQHDDEYNKYSILHVSLLKFFTKVGIIS